MRVPLHSKKITSQSLMRSKIKFVEVEKDKDRRDSDK